MNKTDKLDTAARNIIIEWEAKIITKKTAWIGSCLYTVHGKMELLPSSLTRHGPYLIGASRNFSLDVYYTMSAAKSAASAYYLIFKDIGDVVKVSGVIGNRIARNVSHMPEITGFVNIDTVKVPQAWMSKTKNYLHHQFLSNHNITEPVERMRQRRHKIGFVSSFREDWKQPNNSAGAIFGSCGYQYDYAREVAHVDCSATEELELMLSNE